MSENTDRIIHLDSARLFRVRTVLAVLAPDVNVSYLNPVEIRSGAARLGWASVSLDRAEHQTTVYADLVFAYASPERFSIETEAQKLYARIEGVIDLGHDPYEVVGLYHALLPVVQEVEIFGIEISQQQGFFGQSHLGEAVL